MALKKKSKLSADFNMSALTDIIFLLLIFFMLTSSVVSPNAINLKLPSSSTSNSKNTPVRNPIIVKVTETMQHSINGTAVPFAQLEESLNQYILADGRARQEIIVTLEIDSEVPAQGLVDVVEVITNVGTKMVLNTKATAPTL